MKYFRPIRVKLTEKEQRLLSILTPIPTDREQWKPIAEAQEILFKSLSKRGVIPEIRLRIFADPEFAEKYGKSPKQHFEANARKGDDIFRHQGFQKYLLYMINGPELPNEVISGFCNILNEDAGTSGEVMSRLHAFVREAVRKHELNPHHAATGFYRLAVELDTEFDAHDIRSQAMSVRNR
jgi:hypothetical protein